MDARPSRNLQEYWFFCDQGAVPRTFADGECGKWMLFSPPDCVDERWETAKLALRSGHMEGIVQMKVSTARAVAENAQQQQQEGRGAYKPNHVLIFYCGPACDKQLMTSIGKRVARAMNPSVKSMYICCFLIRSTPNP